MRGFAAALGALALATSVYGHGYVQTVTAGGQTYTGYLPYQDPYTSPIPSRIIRKIPGNGPVEDLSLIDVQCNGWSAGGSEYVGSAPAALTATVAAGSTVSLNWTTWPDSHLGPIITYLAKAPSDITKWSPGTSKVWFKIAESGYSGSQWATQALIAANGIWSFKIPSTLAAGQYLVRHEIIALHSAYAYPGAQVYPSCIQLTVTGSGSATGPSSSSLVAFPGAYTGTTPGIVFDVYQGTPSTYKIPGPTIWTG